MIMADIWTNYIIYNTDVDCTAGLYGQNCEHSCHCANSDHCPNFSGDCPNGCAANWAGTPRCESCADGWIGINCDHSKISHLYSVYIMWPIVPFCIILS